MTKTPDIDNGLFDEIHELIHVQLEGRATEKQRHRLETLVCEDSAARVMYVEYIRDSVNLHSTVAVDGGQRIDNCSDLLDLVKTAERTNSQIPPEAGSQIPPFRTSHRSWLAVAGAVVLLAVGSWGVFEWSSNATDPVAVARVRQTIYASWSRDGDDFVAKPGDTLLSGRYVLDAGLARIVFPWGTEVTLEAPAEIDLRADGSRMLVNGQLIAKVAPEDKGFTIDTPAVRVIDLGTEFGVLVAGDGESEVHVFHGEVETRQAAIDGDTPGNSLRLTARQATSFRVQDRVTQDVVFNPNRFSRAWQAASQITATDGAVHFMHPAPSSVVEAQTEANDVMLVFLERERVSLSDVTAVTITQPGLYTTFVDRAAWLPAGVEVDSYLVHFDPVGSDKLQSSVTAQGSVVFNRPVLAVITRGDQLALSDADCAGSNTQYLAPQKKYMDFYPRGLQGLVDSLAPYGPAGANDWIRLSQDRRTLSIKCTAGGETDQIRVLVSAQGEANAPPKLEAPSLAPSRPFHGQPFSIGQTIEAEDFDQGGPGVGYYDSTPNMLAVYYRPGESVELVRTEKDETVTTHVGRARTGEWLAYSLDVPDTGTYVVDVHVASSYGGGGFRIEFGESSKATKVVIPQTEGRNKFQTVTSTPVVLPAGQHVMRVIMEAHHSGDWVGNIDWLRIRPVVVSPK